MIEYEIKPLISETEFMQYNSILNNRIRPTKKLQTNYYFDTLDFQLNSFGNSLRIRQDVGRLTLQYKYEKQYTGVEKVCEEFEMVVQALPKCILSKNFPYYTLNPSLSYGYVGSPITERLGYFYDKAVISKDKSYYWGKCDFELESEFQDYKIAEEVLVFLAIEKTKIHQIGKYDRSIKELQELRGRLPN